ncbi:MAG: hypothetical protein F6K26_12500 [Moorea sp. SIO2I5]|nr:hypothetical protein [Moorena sp. SIO2I5]
MTDKGQRAERVAFKQPDYIKLMNFAKIETQFVAVLGHHRVNRQMVPAPQHTRCIRSGEIHELVYVAEADENLIDFNDAWYLGFIEFKNGGVLATGMTVRLGSQLIGKVVGFDTTHLPNHYNLLIASKTPKTGQDLGIKVYDYCYFSDSQ